MKASSGAMGKATVNIMITSSRGTGGRQLLRQLLNHEEKKPGGSGGRGKHTQVDLEQNRSQKLGALCLLKNINMWLPSNKVGLELGAVVRWFDLEGFPMQTH